MLSKLGLLLLDTDFNNNTNVAPRINYREHSKPYHRLQVFRPFYMSFDRTVCNTMYSVYAFSSSKQQQLGCHTVVLSGLTNGKLIITL